MIRDKTVTRNSIEVATASKKYVFSQFSPYGESLKGIFDNEEDLAHYSFSQFYYKMNGLEQLSGLTLTSPDGSRLNSKSLDSIIEKYYPEETKIISKRFAEFNGKKVGLFVKLSIQLGLRDFWIIKAEDLFKNLSKDRKNIIEEVKNKSMEYCFSLSSGNKTAEELASPNPKPFKI